MEENELYIFPKLAKKKLNLAKETFQTVYIYGMTGFGKNIAYNALFCKAELYLHRCQDGNVV